MKTTSQATVYDGQGEESAEGGVETQPGDPGKISAPWSLPYLAHHPRVWGVALSTSASDASE